MIVRRFFTQSNYGWTDYSVAEWSKHMKKAASRVKKLAKEHKVDALAVRGSSGLMAGSVLSVALQIPLIYVRKEEEYSHGSKVEGNIRADVRRYLIVDDFIDTGTTLEKIIISIKRFSENNSMATPDCVGAFLYQDTNGTRDYQFPLENLGCNLQIFIL